MNERLYDINYLPYDKTFLNINWNATDTEREKLKHMFDDFFVLHIHSNGYHLDNETPFDVKTSAMAMIDNVPKKYKLWKEIDLYLLKFTKNMIKQNISDGIYDVNYFISLKKQIKKEISILSKKEKEEMNYVYKYIEFLLKHDELNTDEKEELKIYIKQKRKSHL